MPDLGSYDKGVAGADHHVQAFGTDFQRGRHGTCAQRLHQMRSDLGRLDAIAEVLQVGPFLDPALPGTLFSWKRSGAALGLTAGAMVY
jgi:hypothetical protein